MEACFDSATLLKQKQNLERQLFFQTNAFLTVYLWCTNCNFAYLIIVKKLGFYTTERVVVKDLTVCWSGAFEQVFFYILPIMIVHLRVMPQTLPRQRAMVVPDNEIKDGKQTFDVPYSSITARAASRSSLELELSPRESRSCFPRALFDAPNWKPLPSIAICWACEKKRVSITIVG